MPHSVDESKGGEATTVLMDPIAGGHNRMTQPGLELRFENLQLDLKDKKILCDVSGCAKPGEVLAVMGPSGSGKTTLLNIIGGRIRATAGSATIGSLPLTKNSRRKISYVLQEDIFFPNLTLKQTLMFSAELRLPESWSRKTKEEIVEEIVEELEMKNCMKTIIGSAMVRGLSGGEKKRANIANELLTDPAVLLLDEPTSGLDSATAYGIAKTLKRYATKTKKTVLMTVHQPSAQMFFSFDNVLLLSHGKVAYYGSPEDVLDYFAKIGHNCDVVHYNPADFILDMAKLEGDAMAVVLNECNRRRTTNPDCPILKSTLDGETKVPEKPENNKFQYKRSSSTSLTEVDESTSVLLVEENGNEPQVVTTCNGQDLNGKIHKSADDVKGVRSDSSTSSIESEEIDHKRRTWPTSFWKQLIVLTERSFIQGKSRYFSKLKFVKCFGVALICGLMWWQTGVGNPSENRVSDITGFLFFSTLFCSFDPLFDVLQIFPSERTVINKERMAGTYRLSAYYLAKLISELPLTLVFPTIFTTIAYWMTGMNGVNKPWAFFAALFILLALAVAAQSLGLFVSAATMDFDHSLVMAVLLMITFLLLGGYYVQNIPYWLQWLKYGSPITNAWALELYTEFNSDERILCSSDISDFPSCITSQNMTSSSMFGSGNGTLESSVRYVQYQDILDKYSVENPPWVYVLALFAIMIFYRTLGYICLRLFHKPVMK